MSHFEGGRSDLASRRERSDVIAALRALVSAFIRDIESGKTADEAGWLPADAIASRSSFDFLCSNGLLNSDAENHVSLNLKSIDGFMRAMRMDKNLKNQLEYASTCEKSLLQDSARAREAEQILSRLTKLLIDNDHAWSFVVTIGWWRMLEFSGIPAEVQRVLDEGFSPRDWTILATRSSYRLARTVDSDLDASLAFEAILTPIVSTAGIDAGELSSPEWVDDDLLERVTKVLKWKDIIATIPVKATRALGFAWTCYFLWELAGALPLLDRNLSELSASLTRGIKSLTGLGDREIAMSLSNRSEDGVYWADEIIFMPGVI